MPIENIFAYTEREPGFPGFVAINRHGEGRVTITVRSRGNAGENIAEVEVTPEILEQMSDALVIYLYPKDTPAGGRGSEKSKP